MNIIIPLGGKGERFRKDGYTDPKPFIKVLNKEIIYYVIDSLDIKENDNVFIIYNKELNEYNFKKRILEKYSFLKLIELEKDTSGATETILYGLNIILKEYKYYNKTIILDGDTFYKNNILEIFRSNNNNLIYFTKNYDKNPIYSYIKIDKNNNVTEIKEKNKISDNANTGIYAFNDINKLYYYANCVINENIKFNNEYYTSCIIYKMIETNNGIIGIEINNNDVIILGTPLQVNEYIKNN